MRLRCNAGEQEERARGKRSRNPCRSLLRPFFAGIRPRKTALKKFPVLGAGLGGKFKYAIALVPGQQFSIWPERLKGRPAVKRAGLWLRRPLACYFSPYGLD